MIGRQLPLFTPSKTPRPARLMRAQYLAKLAGRTEATNPTDRQTRRAFELALYADRREFANKAQTKVSR